MASDNGHTRKKSSGAANMRGKLSKFQSEYADIIGSEVVDTMQSPSKTTRESNWKTGILGTGSNAFGQVHSDSFDLMSPSFKPLELPAMLKRTAAASGESSSASVSIALISAGSNLSATVIKTRVPRKDYATTGTRKERAPGSVSASSSATTHGNGSSISGMNDGEDLGKVKSSGSGNGRGSSNRSTGNTSGSSSACYLWGSGMNNVNVRVPVSLSNRKIEIKQLSCGQSHAGFVTSDGFAYTWGNGEGGILGHGNKQPVAAPKRIEVLSKMRSLSMSCGAYHTALVVAENPASMEYVRVPSPSSSPSPSTPPFSSLRDRYTSDSPRSEKYLPCGALYCFGVGKAGQLGVDENVLMHGGGSSSSSMKSARIVPRPTKVQFFERNNCKVVKVSCGFHHTLVLTVPASSVSASLLEDTSMSSQRSETSTGISYNSNNERRGSTGSSGYSSSLSPGQHPQYKPSVYAFGWGEHGRLGNGSESQSMVPLLVDFTDGSLLNYLQPGLSSATATAGGGERGIGGALPHLSSSKSTSADYRSESNDSDVHALYAGADREVISLGPREDNAVLDDFMPIEICAGEQHSLAAGIGGCYGWGSNALGQLGVSSPTVIPQALRPCKIPLPEGMVVESLGAGGRHSAAITCCGKLLTWGWGEEGQLGHGTEKSCYLPRPCRLPKLQGVKGRPVAVSLGMSHTLVLMENPDYVEMQEEEKQEPPTLPPTPPPPVEEQQQELVSEKSNPPPPQPDIETPQPLSPPMHEPQHKPARIIADDDEEEVEEEKEEEETVELAVVRAKTPVQGIKELLQQREERLAMRAQQAVESEDEGSIKEETEANIDFITRESTDFVQSDAEEIQDEEEEERGRQEEHESDQKEEEKTLNESSAVYVPPAPYEVNVPHRKIKGYNVFYKEGQDYDSCMVANYAKREEVRRQRKKAAAEKEKEQDKASDSHSRSAQPSGNSHSAAVAGGAGSSRVRRNSFK